jgi:hypothetical protein
MGGVRNGDVCLGYGLRARVLLDNGVEERGVSPQWRGRGIRCSGVSCALVSGLFSE